MTNNKPHHYRKSPSPKKAKNLVYGRHPVMELLEDGTVFEKIFLQNNLRGAFAEKVQELAEALNIPVQNVPTAKLTRLTHQETHQGIAGFTALIPYYQLEDLLTKAYTDGEVPLFLLCDGITDVRNFGAIARSAACTGVHGIIIPMRGAANINGEAIKTSAGALRKVHVCKVRFLDKAIRYLQDNGLQIIVSSLQTDTFLDKADLTIPTAIILGSEGEGVSPKFTKMADQLIKIPIVGSFDSYNVSVATGILLYEAVRQRTGI